MRGVLFDELSLVRRDFFVGEDGVGRANRHAGAAVDAAIGVNIQLGRGLELLVVLLGVNTVGGTSFHAEFVLGAGISNCVRHDCDSPDLVWPASLTGSRSGDTSANFTVQIG